MNKYTKDMDKFISCFKMGMFQKIDEISPHKIYKRDDFEISFKFNIAEEIRRFEEKHGTSKYSKSKLIDELSYKNKLPYYKKVINYIVSKTKIEDMEEIAIRCASSNHKYKHVFIVENNEATANYTRVSGLDEIIRRMNLEKYYVENGFFGKDNEVKMFFCKKHKIIGQLYSGVNGMCCIGIKNEEQRNNSYF